MLKTAKVAEYVGIVLVVLLMTMVVLALLAPHFGWRADTVLSGSMEPALPVGCVQVTRPVKPEGIKAGVYHCLPLSYQRQADEPQGCGRGRG